MSAALPGAEDAPEAARVAARTRTRLATPWGTVEPAPAASDMGDRILDAALALFQARGIARTTMSAIAERADISRVWLYRHHPNQDPVVRAVLARELRRLIGGMASRKTGRDPLRTLVDRLDYALSFLLQLDLFRKLLATEPETAIPMVTSQVGGLLRVGVEAARRDIAALAGEGPEAARMVGETLVRVVLSILITDPVVIDFTDPKARRAYVERLVTKLVR
jgi:AcrR family transcriptional regulator